MNEIEVPNEPMKGLVFGIVLSVPFWWVFIVSRWLAVIVLASMVVLLYWFGGIAAEQAERERSLVDRETAVRHREVSLEVWSAELEEINLAGTIRARELAAFALLDRALGNDQSVQQELSL